jgi:hypothetical protein
MKVNYLAFQLIKTTQNAYGNRLSEGAKNSVSSRLVFPDWINLESLKIRVFNGLYTFWENKRLRWGLILLLIIAPSIKFLYLLFPESGYGDYFINNYYIQIPNTIEGPDSDWYWGLIYMYVHSNGELLAPVISILGIFLLFPPKYYPAYLVGVPFGYYLSLSVHRLFFVSNFESYSGGWTTSGSLLFILLGVIAFVVSDKVLFQENHRKNATQARILGLIEMPGLPWTAKEELIKKEAKDLRKVSNILYEKPKSA